MYSGKGACPYKVKKLRLEFFAEGGHAVKANFSKGGNLPRNLHTDFLLYIVLNTRELYQRMFDHLLSLPSY